MEIFRRELFAPPVITQKKNGHAASDFAPGLTLTVSARIANSRTVAHACLQNQWLLDIPGTLAA
jgi:hypothetical protein